MSAVIIPFPREARLHAALSHEAVLRQFRMAAITAGCNNEQRAAAEGFGLRLLSEGLGAHEAIQRVRSWAERVAHSGPQVPA